MKAIAAVRQEQKITWGELAQSDHVRAGGVLFLRHYSALSSGKNINVKLGIDFPG